MRPTLIVTVFSLTLAGCSTLIQAPPQGPAAPPAARKTADPTADDARRAEPAPVAAQKRAPRPIAKAARAPTRAPTRAPAPAPAPTPAPAPAPRNAAAVRPAAPPKPSPAAEARAAKADAYADFSARAVPHEAFLETLRTLNRSRLPDFARDHDTSPKGLNALIESGKKAEAALAVGCDARWKIILGDRDLRPNAGEICGLVRTWRKAVQKLADHAFESDRSLALASMRAWTEALKARSEAWDDGVAALANPAAWAKARWSRWQAPYAALGLSAPLDFSLDVEELAVGASLADAAREQRFTARDRDPAVESAAKRPLAAAGLEILKSAAVRPDWTVESDGGRPVQRQRWVQVLARRPGERFCRVYALPVKQRWDDARAAYAAPAAELASAETFLVSACK